MNKQEREILEALFWFATEHKNDHWAVYRVKEVLQSVLKAEFRTARLLTKTYGKGE